MKDTQTMANLRQLAGGGNTKLVTLDRRGQYVVIDRPHIQFGDVFVTANHILECFQNTGSGVVPDVLQLVWPVHESATTDSMCFAGLEPLLKERLKRAGLRVRLIGQRPSQLPDPEEFNVDGVDGPDCGVLELVKRVDRGLIRYDNRQVDPVRLIAQIALAWPNKSIVVAATRVHEPVELAQRLKRFVPDVGVFNETHTSAQGKRVVFANYNRLGLGEIGISQRDIYIAFNSWEVFRTVYDSGIQGISLLRHGRIYGLLPDNVCLPPQQRDSVTALFGVEEARVPRHGYKVQSVDVGFISISGCQELPPTSATLETKRARIWRHPVRNRRIGQLAEAIANGDMAIIAESFPNVAGLINAVGNSGVCVLVENIEHALAIRERLPDWPLITADDVCVEGLSDEQLNCLHRRIPSRRRNSGRAIVTSAGMAKTDGFEIIIRADGGFGLPILANDALIVRNACNDRLLVIDFNDRDHPVTRKWSRRRREAYLEAGWNVAGQKAMTPLDKWMSQRPRVRFSEAEKAFFARDLP